MAQASARRRTFFGRGPADESQADDGSPDTALSGRLVFTRAQAVLAGVANCTPAWAAQSLRITAEQLGLPPETVAAYFLNQSESTSDGDGDAVVARLLSAARGVQGAGPSPQEEARLAAVRRYDIVDAAPDDAFERITSMAARLLNTSIATISIVDADRVWFKSHHGLDLTQVDGLAGLCASAVYSDQPLIIEDAATDPIARLQPFVTGELAVRFYVGVPLVTPEGFCIGTLCVIDPKPRALTESDLATLTDLAALVMDELELRLSARRASELEGARRQHVEQLASILQASLLPRALPAIAGISIAARYHVANREQVGGDFYDVIRTCGGCAIVVGDVSGKGAAAATLTGAARWTLRSHLVDDWSPASALTRLNQVLIDAYDDPETYCTVALAQLHLRKSGGADLALSLGGHPRPLILRRDGRIEAVGATDPALGWVSGSQYGQTLASIEPGESMVMFSDGLIEALLHNGVDDHRVHALLSNQHRASAEHIAGILDRHLTGRLRDDAAFLVVRLD